MTAPKIDHSFAMSVPMPDDESRQIVCTGEEDGADIWQPAFGTWSADDFGLDSDEGVGDGERLYVSRRIYDALAARLAAAEAMAEALRLALDYVESCKINDLPDLGAASDAPFMDDVLRIGDAALAAWEGAR